MEQEKWRNKVEHKRQFWGQSLALCPFVILGLLLCTCRKYPDGQWSHCGEICIEGHYKISEYLVDDTDSLNFLLNTKLQCSPNHIIYFTGETGKSDRYYVHAATWCKGFGDPWEFVNKKKNIRFYGYRTLLEGQWIIFTAKKGKLSLIRITNGKKYKITFESITT